MTDPAIVTLFPTQLMRSEHPDPENVFNILKPGLEKVTQTVPSGPADEWPCPVFSTYQTANTLHQSAPFDSLNDFVLSEVLSFAENKNIDLSAHGFDIFNCWLNVLRQGDFIDQHSNMATYFTAIYFVLAPPDGSVMSIDNPDRDMGLSLSVDEETPINAEGISVVPGPGDLVVFESHIVHGFKVHKSSDPHVHLVFTIGDKRG